MRVSVSGPDSAESPVPGVVLTAVPFDRDSVLGALEHAAPTPRPGAAELDSLLGLYRAPFAELSAASQQATALHDSISAPGADSARFRPALKSSDARVAAARKAVDAVRGTADARVDSLRRGIATWENSTYVRFESIVTARLRPVGGAAINDTTGADGWTRMHIPAGNWWIYATSWDVSDPNRYWYWNARVTRDTVRFDSKTGIRRTRY